MEGSSETDCLDHELRQEMQKLVEQLTTSGKPILNAETMKKFKNICKKSDMYVKEAYHMLMTQLEKDHSEIRLSAFQMIDELFNRSHSFREMLLCDLQTYLELTVEVDFDQPLPPPKAAANTLKASALRAIQQWNDKFGEAYKKLSLGFNFLQKCKKVDFNGIRARSEAEQRREREREERRQRINRERINKVLKEIEETVPDIKTCMTEVDNCFSILLPTPDDFFLDVESSEDKECLTNVEKQKKSKTEKSDIMHCSDSEKSLQFDKGDSCENCLKNQKDNEKTGGMNKDQRNSIKNSCTHSSESSEINVMYTENSEHGKLVEPESSKHSCVSDEPSIFSNVESDSQTSEKHEKGADSEELSSSSDADDDLEEVGEFVQEHGLRNHQYSIAIDLQRGPVQLEENEDNLPVLTTLKDHYRLISTKHQPSVTRWLQVLSKHGGKEEDIKRVIDIKAQLQKIRNKFYDLKVVPLEEQNKSDDESEDDFEEVPEKEGYEEDVPRNLKSESGQGPSTSNKNQTLSSLKTSTTCTKTRSSAAKQSTLGAGAKRTFVKASWSIKNELLEHDEKDPTTMIANLKRIKAAAETQGSPNNNTSMAPGKTTASDKTTGDAADRKEKLLSSAPVVSFGVDLEHWESPDKIEAPQIVKFDSLHRFWNSTDVEHCKSDSNNIGELTKRTIPFVGKFEPVKWKCRAPLANGSLCERMDRVKCPFHGKIIGRDEYGCPTESNQQEQASTSAQGQSEEDLEDWRDPELQADIEAALGVDLGSKKGKGKGKGKKNKEPKYPNLTDINIVKNTSRNRLEKKVLSKSSLKRVNNVMDNLAYKRIRDRFGNQFNYSLK
uniref:UV-stimulated scaffold protein A-like n=1 Tax=Crassostrea virginica TaxID=6565 RepID=A0A8B8ENL1_CRAVI|nr:UV-stimulated scaffold protein A-like [Crassostrea virginica]XP_022341510.1 UV-stimulated scaffold protein A-like [Crassostrea virginica]